MPGRSLIALESRIERSGPLRRHEIRRVGNPPGRWRRNRRFRSAERGNKQKQQREHVGAGFTPACTFYFARQLKLNLGCFLCSGLCLEVRLFREFGSEESGNQDRWKAIPLRIELSRSVIEPHPL